MRREVADRAVDRLHGVSTYSPVPLHRAVALQLVRSVRSPSTRSVPSTSTGAWQRWMWMRCCAPVGSASRYFSSVSTTSRVLLLELIARLARFVDLKALGMHDDVDRRRVRRAPATPSG